MKDITQLPAVQIQIRHHRQTLNIRSQDRIVQNSLFSEAWTFATRDQRKEVMDHINTGKPAKVKDWVSQIMIGTLDRCNTEVLRNLARYHKIPYYGQLPKTALIDALNKKGEIK